MWQMETNKLYKPIKINKVSSLTKKNVTIIINFVPQTPQISGTQQLQTARAS